MGRIARRISETGMYHVMFRGVGKQNIFNETADYVKLKELIRRVKEETEFELYAYCFMTNHVHLFIKEQNPGDLSIIMKRILGSYATWFNRKYIRAGALFNSRYKSEPVEDERYFYGLTRYIHQNPQKAGIAKSIDEYKYSSYNEYANDDPDITDIDFLLDMLGGSRKSAITQFIEINGEVTQEDYTIIGTKRKSRAVTRAIISSELDGLEPEEIKALEIDERNEIISRLVSEKGLMMSEIARETGFSRNTIVYICRGYVQKVLRPQSKQKRNIPAIRKTKVDQVEEKNPVIERNLPAHLM
ncbi:MAG: transposase [Ruminococcaceae bacterium]|nr:transposase [Oscillospiraceae bacterium]